MENNAKPLFRYIGGKTWLKKELNQVLENSLRTNNIKSYTEPFMGGLGAFFANCKILLKYDIKTINLNDINSVISNCYNDLILNNDDLFYEYSKLENQMKKQIPQKAFSLDPKKDKEKIKLLLNDSYEFYLEKRNEFNLNKNNKDLINSALIIFLQFHCFNGIYRENSKGDYNTAFNWEIKNFENNLNKIKNCKLLLDNFDITFSNMCFKELEFHPDSFIYCDPPYINDIKNTENKYHKKIFDLEEMKILIKKLNSTHFAFSHYENETLIDLFSQNNMDFQKLIIERKNNISGKLSTRQSVKREMLLFSC